MLKRFLVLLAALSAALLLFTAPAQSAPGGNPHFIKSATSAVLSGSDLIVSFKEAGLPNGQVETIVVSASLTATYQCVNNGGVNPNDPKKTTVTTTVSAEGQFSVQNGNVTGTLTLSVPAAATQLDCPPGQTATLSVFSYTDVAIDDITSGASTTVRGTFSGGTLID